MLVTVYFIGPFGMGVNKVEGKLVQHGRKRYAQYASSPFVHFIPKGKRKTRGVSSESDNPFILILKGHNLPSPQSPFVPVESSTPGVSVSHGRYSSFSSGYANDFNAMINPLIASGAVEVVADYRGVNVYEPIPVPELQAV